MTGARLLFVIAMAIATMCAALMFATHDVHYVIRWTARTSLVLFALAYMARPATVLWPRPATKWLLRERKWLGDGFALSHLAHLAGITALGAQDWTAFFAAWSPARTVATAMFVVLFAMAITSIERVRKAMSKRAWTALHRTGMHMAWAIFTVTYVGRLADHPAWAAPVALLAAIGAIRAAAWQRRGNLGRETRRAAATR